MTINGVDTETFFATIDAVKENPELAQFQFRATNRWISGTHNQSTINGYFGAGQEQAEPGAVGGRVVGTPLYLAPEVLAGAEATVQSDIYSLGVLLYHLVTNDYPVRAAAFADLDVWMSPTLATPPMTSGSSEPRKRTITSEIRPSG